MSKSFWSSSHKWTYIKMALKHKVMPQHIYELAHGAEPHEADEAIMHELKEMKLIHSKKHHTHHHHHHRQGGVKKWTKCVKAIFSGWH